MKKYLSLGVVLLLSVFTLALSSCSNNDEPTNNPDKPILKVSEVGIENNKIALAGSNLHMEGDITAPGKVKSFEIKVYDRSGTVIGDTLFDEKNPDTFVGSINPHFHIHVNLNNKATLGEGGKVEITLTDQAGQTENYSEVITVEQAIVQHVTGLNVIGPDGQTANGIAGQPMTVSADEILMYPGFKIDGMEIEFHNEAADMEIVFTSEKDSDEKPGYWEELAKNPCIGKEKSSFNESFTLPDYAPAGTYHLHFTVISGDTEQTYEVEGINVKGK